MVNGHAPALPVQPETASNKSGLCKKASSSMVRLCEAQHVGAWDCERAGQVYKDMGGPPGMTCMCVCLDIVAATSK